MFIYTHKVKGTHQSAVTIEFVFNQKFIPRHLLHRTRSQPHVPHHLEQRRLNTRSLLSHKFLLKMSTYRETLSIINPFIVIAYIFFLHLMFSLQIIILRADASNIDEGRVSQKRTFPFLENFPFNISHVE